jgi:WD40 repeat protein
MILASGSADGTIRIWSVATGKELALLEGHPSAVHSLSFSPDATMLAAYAREARIWQLEDGSALTELIPRRDKAPVEIISKGMTSVGWFMGFLDAVDPMHPDRTVVGPRIPLSFSPDGKYPAVMRFNPKWSTDYEVVILDLVDKTVIAAFPCKGIAMAFSPDGKRLATTAGLGIQLWDVLTGAQIASSR